MIYILSSSIKKKQASAVFYAFTISKNVRYSPHNVGTVSLRAKCGFLSIPLWGMALCVPQWLDLLTNTGDKTERWNTDWSNYYKQVLSEVGETDPDHQS